MLLDHLGKFVSKPLGLVHKFATGLFSLTPKPRSDSSVHIRISDSVSLQPSMDLFQGTGVPSHNSSDENSSLFYSSPNAHHLQACLEGSDSNELSNAATDPNHSATHPHSRARYTLCQLLMRQAEKAKLPLYSKPQMRFGYPTASLAEAFVYLATRLPPVDKSSTSTTFEARQKHRDSLRRWQRVESQSRPFSANHYHNQEVVKLGAEEGEKIMEESQTGQVVSPTGISYYQKVNESMEDLSSKHIHMPQNSRDELRRDRRQAWVMQPFYYVGRYSTFDEQRFDEVSMPLASSYHGFFIG
ncbi:unnamed protein product [Protopolystoma xenopodis]|uniref:Uncharacterized protein n=1 Tax=Protopolystoma xenopodis TaxID=117903 RepID=A0A448XIT6_9PLAT|nr:unnamed protein product [Protopolystoma xenopodis]